MVENDKNDVEVVCYVVKVNYGSLLVTTIKDYFGKEHSVPSNFQVVKKEVHDFMMVVNKIVYDLGMNSSVHVDCIFNVRERIYKKSTKERKVLIQRLLKIDYKLSFARKDNFFRNCYD